jgi:hypothetical protein
MANSTNCTNSTNGTNGTNGTNSTNRIRFKVVFDAGQFLFGFEETDGSLGVLAWASSIKQLRKRVDRVVRTFPPELFGPDIGQHVSHLIDRLDDLGLQFERSELDR